MAMKTSRKGRKRIGVCTRLHPGAQASRQVGSVDFESSTGTLLDIVACEPVAGKESVDWSCEQAQSLLRIRAKSQTSQQRKNH